MSNMGYCRMENTYKDLLDCFEYFEKVYSESERYYREKLYDIALQMVEEYEDFDFDHLANYDDGEE